MVVLAGLGQVADPLDGLVAGLLEDPQEAHSEPRRREHGDLELQLDRRLDPRLVVAAAHKLNITTNQVLGVARYLLDPA